MSTPTPLLMPSMPSLSVTSPTPTPSPLVSQPAAEAIPGPDSLQTPPRVSGGSTKGKRKADEVEGGNTPPDAKKDREQKATFAVGPRPLRASNATTTNSSQAPSSFHRQKRARLSTPTESRPGSRAGTDPKTDPANETAATIGSWASRKSITRPGSRGAQSIQSRTGGASLHRAPSRRSISQSSIPISALISPHAPSIARSGGAFHMRDPHKPARIQPTGWALSVGAFDGSWRRWTEAGGSPLHAWLFFIGFVLFPVWWGASFIRVLRTRRVGKEREAQVVLDDPQLEFDARTWRNRCRIMAVVSLVTYVPFIILVAVFARRR